MAALNAVASATNVLWKPLRKQALALSCPAAVEDILFGGAVGGGKTDFLLAAWVQHAAQHGQHAIGLLVRRTIPELHDIMARAQRLFPSLGAVSKQSGRVWVFRNGAKLRLSYVENMDDATRYQGQEFTWVGVDEAGSYRDPAPLDFLRSRIRTTAPGVRTRFILTANPGGRGHSWLAGRYVKGRQPYVPFEATDDEGNGLGFLRVYIPSRLTDNPYLMADKSYVRRILASGPRWLVRALLLGDWNITLDAGVLKREWWREFSMLPSDERIHIVQSWDTSYGKTTRGDRSVCTTWAIYPNGYYLLDCWAGRLDFPALKRKVIDLAARWGVWEVMVEDAASGQSLVQELLRETGLGLVPIKPLGDKVARAYSVAPLIESGRVFIPAAGYRDPTGLIEPSWRSDFLDECSAFPEAAHDDIVDSVSQALRALAARYTVGANADYSFTLADIYADE